MAQKQEQVFAAANVDGSGRVAFALSNSVFASVVYGAVTMTLDAGQTFNRQFDYRILDAAGNILFDAPLVLFNSGSKIVYLSPSASVGLGGTYLQLPEMPVPPGGSIAIDVVNGNIDTNDTVALAVVLDYS